MRDPSTSATGCLNGCKDILIAQNLMSGGAYTIYTGGAPETNYRVTDNHFSTREFPKVGAFGIWYNSIVAGEVRSGNVIHETGVAANG
jgi:hypothetical protein